MHHLFWFHLYCERKRETRRVDEVIVHCCDVINKNVDDDDDDEFVTKGTGCFCKIGQLQMTWKLEAICKDSKSIFSTQLLQLSHGQ